MMRTRPLPWLLGWLLLVAGAAGPTRAQSSAEGDLEEKIKHSHFIDAAVFGLRGADAESLFQLGAKKFHAREMLEQYKKQNGFAGTSLDEFIKTQPDFVEHFIKNFQFDNLPLDFRERFRGREQEIENLIHNLTPADLKRYSGAGDGLGATGPGGSANDKPADAGAAQQPTPTEREQPKAAEASATDAPEETDGNSILGRWLREAAEHIKDVDPALRNSPAFNRAVRELSHKLNGGDERWKAVDKGLNAVADKWVHLGQVLPLDRVLPRNGLSWPRSLTPRSLPNLRMPSLGPRSSSAAGRGLFDLGEGSGWRGVAVLVLVGIFGLILWKVLSQTPQRKRGQEAKSWHVGPWPVQPEAIRNGDELVRAFEYLSVLRLGPMARHWHHWAIASGLGRAAAPAPTSHRTDTDNLERRRAAEQLASLYEQARYAPPGEPLSEAALATARRDLCLLAGVPAA